MKGALPPYRDPDHAGNGPAHRTGLACIEPGCGAPAGTTWSPLWCFEHNAKRMDRINTNLAALQARMGAADHG